MSVNTSSIKSSASSAVSAVTEPAAKHGRAAYSSASNAVSAVTEPAAKHSRAAYGRFQEGVQWYFEHWEDLVHEARADLPHSEESLSADSILKSLSDAKVASDTPGRVRLRVAQLKGQDKLTEPLAETLGSLPGVKQVEISSLTGSILMIYDKKTYPSREALMSALGA